MVKSGKFEKVLKIFGKQKKDLVNLRKILKIIIKFGKTWESFGKLWKILENIAELGKVESATWLSFPWKNSRKP